MDVLQTTKIILAWELFEQGLLKSHIAKQLGIHRETVGIYRIIQQVTGVSQT